MSQFSSNVHARGVFFDNGPILLASYDDPDRIEDRVSFVGEIGRAEARDADDSLEMIASHDTGAGRAHTPLRPNRTHTPQRPRSSSLLHTAAVPVQAVTPRREGDARRQPLGRRKQRRWDNDNLIGVEKFLRGRNAQDEGEANHLTVTHSWRSSLSILVSDRNTSTAGVAEAREKVRNGLQPSRHSSKRGFSNQGSRHFAGGKWADAEERFLLVERRLRDVVVRALRSTTLIMFVSGLETLLEAFAQRQWVDADDVSPGLVSSLTALPSVKQDTLLVSLGPSPFHRLLLHALCQYWKLRSRSEETNEGRVVRVTNPSSASKKTFPLPHTFLAEFVIHARLGGETAPGSTRCRQSAASALTPDSDRATSKEGSGGCMIQRRFLKRVSP